MDKIKSTIKSLCTYKHLHEKWLSDKTILVMMQTKMQMSTITKRNINRALSSMMLSDTKYVDGKENEIHLHLHSNSKRLNINGSMTRCMFYYISTSEKVPLHLETQNEWVNAFYFNPIERRSINE